MIDSNLVKAFIFTCILALSSYLGLLFISMVDFYFGASGLAVLVCILLFFGLFSLVYCSLIEEDCDS